MNKARMEAPSAEYEGIAPLLGLQEALRFWWLLVALAALGALLGWALNSTRPALYESTARLPVGIDFVSTGPMSQYEEDLAFEMVGSLIITPDVLARAAAKVSQAVTPLTPEELYQTAILERRLNVWELRVRAENPQAAEQIANLWMDEAYAVISESHQHAVLAARWMNYARSLESCLARTAASEPVSGQCEGNDFNTVQADLMQAGNALRQEQVASRGLFSGLTIGLPERAAAPNAPIRLGQAGFALGGALLGLTLAVAAIETGLARRIFRKR